MRIRVKISIEAGVEHTHLPGKSVKYKKANSVEGKRLLEANSKQELEAMDI